MRKTIILWNTVVVYGMQMIWYLQHRIVYFNVTTLLIQIPWIWIFDYNYLKNFELLRNLSLANDVYRSNRYHQLYYICWEVTFRLQRHKSLYVYFDWLIYHRRLDKVCYTVIIWIFSIFTLYSSPRDFYGNFLPWILSTTSRWSAIWNWMK